MAELKVGDEIYYEIYNGMIDVGHITQIRKLENGDGMVKVSNQSRNYILRISDCYPTYELLEEAIKVRSAKQKSIYRDMIHNINDLVKFMYNIDTTHEEEDTNWEARKVAAEKAMEYLGIDLDKDVLM